MESNQKALHTTIAERSNQLIKLSAELKSELFGIDNVIDRVIDSLRAWFVLPEIINRPVIICLWGLTGTGKTQLMRSIAQKLGFYDRFVEVQMDGFSNGSGYQSSSISSMLSDSGVQEGAPGILVLDEFQRFRTVNSKGEDVKVERYQDVWTLLSDGRLAPALSFISTIEYTLADSHYDQESERAENTEKGKAPRLFKLTPYEARNLKKCLKLKESLLEIMGWSPVQIQQRLHEFRRLAASWETDYSKLLVFVSGNLDEMYEETAKRVEDCDTDADIFHELTKKLSIIDVKKALRERFKPEQIARLGNEHVIYPSFSRATYEKLIDSTCVRYVQDIKRTSQLHFVIDQAVQTEIYSNAVFPAQGTRPLFSSIHAILSSPLVNATLWAIERGAVPNDQINVTLDKLKGSLLVQWHDHQIAFPVTFELNQLKQRADSDFRSLLAVHEAGHALLYCLLFHQTPKELKINTASFEGGYTSYVKERVHSRQSSLNMICVELAGRVAEIMVFGAEAGTTGAETDLKQATSRASKFVRHHGFGDRLSRTDTTQNSDENINTDIQATNISVEAVLSEQFSRAENLLREHSSVFLHIANELVLHSEVPQVKLAAWLGVSVSSDCGLSHPYADRLVAFGDQLKLMERLNATSVGSLVELAQPHDLGSTARLCADAQ